MQIVCLGISHQNAPVALREKFAVPEREVGTAANDLAQAAGVQEALILSTCNRVEWYLAAEDAGGGLRAVRSFLAQRTGSFSSEFFVEFSGAQCVRHLFRVVSGLESMVLGETEILGQTKKAYQAGQFSQGTRRHLNKLFQRAFNVAKEVRTRTNITRGSVSVGSVAVDLAEKIFGRLADCRVMLLGAGERSELNPAGLRSRA